MNINSEFHFSSITRFITLAMMVIWSYTGTANARNLKYNSVNTSVPDLISTAVPFEWIENDALENISGITNVGAYISEENASVKFTKVVNNIGFKKGDVLNYTLLAKNTGKVTLYDIRVVDEMADNASVLPIKVEYILPGATAVFMTKKTLTQEDIDRGFFSNQAVFYSRDALGNIISAVSDDPATLLINDPTVSYFKTVTELVTSLSLKDTTQTTYNFGEKVLYTIRVRNNGKSVVKNVNIINVAPSGTNIIHWEAKAKGLVLPQMSGQGNLNQVIESFFGGCEVEFEVAVQTSVEDAKILANTSLCNTIVIKSGASGVDQKIHRLTSPSIDVVVSNDLSIVTKSNQSNEVIVNTPFEYDFSVKNSGFFSGTMVSVECTLPANLSYISHSKNVGTIDYDVNKNIIVWNVEHIDAGEVIGLQLKVKAKNAGMLTTTATVSAKEKDFNLINNSSINQKLIAALVVKPNVITPNGDGKNDTFVIDGLELYPENSINIFNRWGNEVFRSVGSYKNNWDGYSLKEGTYYYIFKIKDTNGNWSATKGFITLLRNN